MKLLSNILSLFKGGQTSPVTSPSNSDELQIDGITSIYFHEDDYCQIELVPRENEGFLIAQGAEIQRSAEKNFDGYGYKDIHVRSEEPVSLSTKGIPVDQMAEILGAQGFLRIDTVFTGYSTHRERAKDTVAFKLDPFVVYMDCKDGIVAHAWLDLNWGASSESQMRFIDALDQMGRKWQLLLSHWPGSRIVDLTDRAAIENYVTIDPQ